MDISDIQQSITDRLAEMRGVISDLESMADELESAETDFDTALSEHAEAIATTLDEEYARVEGEGPGEGETADQHERWLEGFQAAIDHLREQYT